MLPHTKFDTLVAQRSGIFFPRVSVQLSPPRQPRHETIADPVVAPWTVSEHGGINLRATVPIT